MSIEHVLEVVPIYFRATCKTKPRHCGRTTYEREISNCEAVRALMPLRRVRSPVVVLPIRDQQLAADASPHMLTLDERLVTRAKAERT